MSKTEETVLNNSSNEPTMQDFMKLFFSQFAQTTKSVNPSDSRTVGKDEISFQLTAYDPDDTSYSIEEWLKDVNNIRTKIKIDDDIMIFKAGAALQGKARKFYNGWRPLIRTWATFEDDLITAFPDHETWHTKLVRAANMKSSDFDSISEYAIEKIRSLYRFYSDLPWDRILSPVVGRIESSAPQALLQVHGKLWCRSLNNSPPCCENNKHTFYPGITDFNRGKGSIRALGRCQLHVSLQKATLEIDFLVVPDHTIPDVDALIGLETISRHGIKIVTQKYGIDLQLCKPKPGGVRTLQVHPDLSGVDEQHRGRLQNLLATLRSTSQNSVTTGKSQIKLTDVVPVKNKTAAQTVKVLAPETLTRRNSHCYIVRHYSRTMWELHWSGDE
ncbi:hypothetical protein GEV33_009802 [Tenebrio molitor]|uniref:Uncharacterized protein n=1 Tax=Tenebrio molitor TaxID=7067 RepID=A0A8J6L9D8_TENMO|nr:hypothetical protein GEV33_009802 [Tenebrio molitor]